MNAALSHAVLWALCLCYVVGAFLLPQFGFGPVLVVVAVALFDTVRLSAYPRKFREISVLLDWTTAVGILAGIAITILTHSDIGNLLAYAALVPALSIRQYSLMVQIDKAPQRDRNRLLPILRVGFGLLVVAFVVVATFHASFIRVLLGPSLVVGLLLAATGIISTRLLNLNHGMILALAVFLSHVLAAFFFVYWSEYKNISPFEVTECFALTLTTACLTIHQSRIASLGSAPVSIWSQQIGC